MSDIEREAFEQAVTDRWSDSYSFTRFGDEDYYDEVLEGMWRGWQASRQALEGEPVNGSRIEEVCVQALIDIGGCAWGIEGYPTTKEAADWMWNAANTALAEMWDSDMSVLNSEKSQSPIGYTNWAQLSYVKSDGQGSFYPDTADDCFIPLYTHPASRQAVSVPKQWVDLMRELVKDLISEIKTKQKLKPDERVAEDLGAVREAIAMIEKQEQGHEWIKCSEQRPNVLDVWIKMTDGSVVACWSQLDGDFYWNGGGSESYILENTVTHWKPRQQEQGQ